MRFIYGQGWTHLFDQTDGTDGKGTTGGAAAKTDDQVDDTVVVDDAGKTDDGTKADDGAKKDEGKKDDGQPKDMLQAITEGLAKTAPAKTDVEDPEAKKAADAAALAANVAAAGKHANGAPKKNEKGEELDDKGAVVPKQAPKVKTSDELALTADERKVLGAKAQARFSEVFTTLKTRETEIAQLTEKMKPLSEARDTMIGLLDETNTSSDQLAAYLEFNRMLSSNDPKQLESALQMVENQRAALYVALGREPVGGGVDLLAEFADLKEKVAEGHMTREAALEVAQARRAGAAAEAAKTQQKTRQEGVEQVKKAQEKGLADITAWTNDLSKKDIDYKAKEEKLLEQVDEVIKNYPPNQWLSTLKLLYAGIVIQKPDAGTKKGEAPIRPSGLKAGAKAPQNMFEAMWGGKAP